jgi:hypothetical protein
MTEPDPKPPIDRNKLIGRLVIIAFGALLLVYFVPLAWKFIKPH